MATSGTTVYQINRDEVMLEALEMLGVYEPGATVSAADRTSLSRTLNLIVKQWATNGWMPWLLQTASISLVVGTASYTIAPSGAALTANRPMRIAQAWLRDSNSNDTPLIIISNQEYSILTPKNQAGIPNSLFYDAQIVAGVLYPWPVMSITGYTLYIRFQRQIEDVSQSTSASTETFDMPQEWFLPLAYALAARSGFKFTSNLIKLREIKTEADRLEKVVADWSREEATVMFQPSPQRG